MKKCAGCFQEFVNGDKLVAYSMETFVFKPAHIEDPEVFEKKEDGTMVKVNLAAVKDPDYLRELRKEHQKTERATHYITYQEDQPLPSNLFNIRHVICSIMRTGAATNRNHPLVKHSVRYGRAALRR